MSGESNFASMCQIFIQNVMATSQHGIHRERKETQYTQPSETSWTRLD